MIMKYQNQITKLITPIKLLYTNSNLLKLCCYIFILLATFLTFQLTIESFSHKFSLHDMHITLQTPQKLNVLTIASPSIASKHKGYAVESYATHGVMSDEELMLRASKVPKMEELQLKKVPYKIAFLFLIKGSLPLAALWEEFFKGHEGFYSIYVHPDPSFNFSNGVDTGVFHGRKIPSKKVEWGKFSMIEAELRLLATALQDASNKRFVLLSESCIPLFNFSTIYTYLINSTQSYVEAYDKSGPTARGRYKHRLSPTITIRDWRKGSQWFEMDRELAMEVISDQLQFLLFKRACNNSACYADEHYLPTWVNMYSRGRNSNRSVTWVDWSRGGCHPVKYRRMHITTKFLQSLRVGKTCQYNGKRADICFLFARKFLPETLNRLLWFAPKVMDF